MRSYNDYKRNRSEYREGGEQDDYEDQSKSSPNQNVAKIIKTQNYLKQSESQSESEQSSLSQQEDSYSKQDQLKKQTTKHNNKYPIIRQHQSESQDQQEQQQKSSIDQIQQRIKTLQKNLQMKIDKHKLRPEEKKIDEKNFSEIAKPLKNASSPPLPKKFEQKAIPVLKNNQQLRVYKQNKHSGNNNKFTVQKEISKVTHQHQRRLEDINQGYKNTQQIELLKQSPKSKAKAEIQQPSGKNQNLGQREQNKKINNANNHKKYVDIQANYNLALEKINQLQHTVDKLKQQNKQLKKNLSQKQKKKANPQLDKLKEISENKDEKLQKQIQLLKVIETLQAKLKKSIQKKMRKNKVGSSSLLHKGLPATFN